MDVLAFDIASKRNGSFAYREVAILVNGRDLRDLAQVVEAPHALAEGSPTIAGGYSPLATHQFNDDPKHFLGQPIASWFDDGDTVLMGCDCGEWGCWPLTALVEVADDIVRWSGFRTGHREWDLSGLGPFAFDRAQYEGVLASIDSKAV